MIKKVDFTIKGMQRDSSVATFNNSFAYNIKNMRIMPTEESTLYSLVNERGNKEIPIIGIHDILVGIPLGQCLMGNNLIIFTKGVTNELNTPDRIYKIWVEEDGVHGVVLFWGDLNFNTLHPIEALAFYENEDIQKVYWTDGINQPRVINIMTSEEQRLKWGNNSFDFVRDLDLNEVANISKIDSTIGQFAPGVIQYCFAYFNKYLQESSIFYTSPLYYISHSNRGASPEEKVANAFAITLNNLQTNFEYVRIYSIHRTSLDSIPTVKVICDSKVTSQIIFGELYTTIRYTDNGLNGYTIDPSTMLYIGGEDISCNTMNYKDNTLFLGGLTLNRRQIDVSIKNYFKFKPITFNNFSKILYNEEPKGYYSYNSQLTNNSQSIKHFKYLEWYRFGVQFQHKTGKWSDPVFINDCQNDKHIEGSYVSAGELYFPIAQFGLTDPSVINDLVLEGFINCRPVIVYPTINDRECICQGVLCPTVFNVGDRYGNSPFAQASWFSRPNSPYDLVLNTTNWRDRNDAGITPSINSKAGVILNYNNTVAGQYLDTMNLGVGAEFRHNTALPSNNLKNAEIQSTVGNNPLLETPTPNDKSKWVSENKELFYVDQSIITLHSPEIEFDDSLSNLDTSKLKLRIVGIVPMTGSIGDNDIQVTTPQKYYNGTDVLPPGLYKEVIGAFNISKYGWRSFISAPSWMSEASHRLNNNSAMWNTGFVIYPWHRSGGVTNEYVLDGDKRHSTLGKKKLSNSKYSYNSVYFNIDKIWKAFTLNSDLNTGISGVNVFNTKEVELIKLKAPLHSNLPDLNYYGNIDTILTCNSSTSSKKYGYPIEISGHLNTLNGLHELFVKPYVFLDDVIDVVNQGSYSRDPIPIKYKSTPHAVMALNYTTTCAQRVLPTLLDGVVGSGLLSPINTAFIGQTQNSKYFWDLQNTAKGVYQDTLDISFYNNNLPKNGNDSLDGYGPEHGFLWLGELYNDDVVMRFGGQIEEAFENNLWLPCGDKISLLENGIPKTTVLINWVEGDIYYQRYDHLKTYPSTLEDTNSVTEIISFMCETRVNLDGRYDKNRGQTNNLGMTPSNFNLMNKVYSQSNNFFNYRYINGDSLNLNNFPNSITWTLSKTAGETIDSWTNITMVSTLDLDGDKGSINSIKRFNNELITFQDKGISNILYNSRTQLSTPEGVPIEIANSGKVDGKRYISDKMGCTNKWSICESPMGLYFIDDLTKSICLFNGKIDDLSDKLGFHSWINTKSISSKVWNPVDFDSFISYYDKITGDVYFISKTECLSFSEPLGQFSSFYSYEKTPYFFMIGDRGFTINKAFDEDYYKIWGHREGDYNMFFNKYQPFEVTFIANPDPNVDKIFNTLEFRSDTYNSLGVLQAEKTFDTLKVWNEYQTNTVSLSNVLGYPSNLKRKFRVWRANIPRDSFNRSRMRNTWLYLTLKMNNITNTKTILHNTSVTYFD